MKKAELKTILSTQFDNPCGCILINGDWGTGKTYIIKEWLTEQGRECLYVSLFGLANIAEAQEKILTEKIVASGASEKTNWITTTLGLFPIVKRYVDADSIFKKVMLSRINGCVIWLDDIERISEFDKNLDHIIGFISTLITERNCNVILSSNIKENEWAKKRHALEKLELNYVKFIRDVEEINKIVFNETKYQTIMGLTIQHNITNIRILKRIKACIDSFEKYCTKELTYNKLCTDSIVGVLSMYGEIQDMPSINQLYGWKTQYSFKERPKSPQELIIESFSFIEATILSRSVFSFIEFGSFDELELNDYVSRIEENISKEALANDYNEFFVKIWNNYKTNDCEVITRLVEFIKSNRDRFSIEQHFGLYKFVMQYSQKELNEQYEQVMGGFVKEVNVSTRNNESAVDLQEWIGKYVKINLIESERDDPGKLIEILSSANGWHPEDEIILSTISPDVLARIIREMDHIKTHKAINTLLRFGRFSNASERQIEIAENMKKALAILSKESVINGLRVSRYNA